MSAEPNDAGSASAGSPHTVDELLRAAALALAAHSDSPRLDAELLLAHALGWRRETLFISSREPVSPSVAEEFRALVAERRRHRPVAQLLGRQEFWSLELRVTPDVLTPRPETELLVEAALARLPPGQSAKVLDLGTGSGAVALAIARERPLSVVTATDRSEAALAVARENAARLAVGNVFFLQGDWYGAVGAERFGLIVSNPPYIAEDERTDLSPELCFEPAEALWAGTDGLDAMRMIAGGAVDHLERGAWLLVEHGWRQGDAVRDLLGKAGMVDVETLQDLAGRERMTAGRKPASDRR